MSPSAKKPICLGLGPGYKITISIVLRDTYRESESRTELAVFRKGERMRQLSKTHILSSDQNSVT